MKSVLAHMKNRLEEYIKEYRGQMEYFITSIEEEKRTSNFENNSISFMSKQNELHAKIKELSFWVGMIESLGTEEEQ